MGWSQVDACQGQTRMLVITAIFRLCRISCYPMVRHDDDDDDGDDFDDDDDDDDDDDVDDDDDGDDDDHDKTSRYSGIPWRGGEGGNI
ncbi:hypothetical protein ElyMa_003070800 [Elysia marginata]|uniref:Uncharacterized protein n=1 Tax=Elysia marginata TaxID=1093978 RepID=A0AAV4IL79_9GAST|nr:hypothetical protein ElyMa_003070800 [Elysia marginata]